VDTPEFDLDRHLSHTERSTASASGAGSGGLGDDEQLLRIAADLVCTPLPASSWRGRPGG
jgi:hypothetical protein